MDDFTAIEALSHLERGQALAASGDRAGAMGAYRHAVAVRPDWSAPYLALADVQIRTAEYLEALDSLATARAVGDDSALVWRRIGLAFAGLRQWTAASSALLAAVERDPKAASTWHSLGHVLRVCGNVEEARNALRHAAEGDETAAIPEWIETIIDRGELVEATTLLHKYHAVLDGATRAWLLARVAFLAGDLETGWLYYESRFEVADGLRSKGVELVTIDAPQWRGEGLVGRRIAVIAEQGHGDVIQFGRFVRPLADRGATVHLVLPTAMGALVPLLETVDGVSTVELVPDVSTVDFKVPLLSIPYHLGTRLDSIPTRPYLRTASVAVLPGPLRNSRAFNVGIIWGGDPNHGNDRHRSTTLESMLGLSSVPAVRLFSLQLGLRTREVIPFEALVTDLGRGISNWSDTASIVSALDLVISVDTAVAHLAGALQRPTWVALAYAPDWRWLLEREDTPWYPTMRLFRQPTPGDWGAVFRRMRDLLSSTVRPPGTTG